eukprot:349598-Prymnesium_polylepis.1
MLEQLDVKTDVEFKKIIDLYNERIDQGERALKLRKVRARARNAPQMRHVSQMPHLSARGTWHVLMLIAHDVAGTAARRAVLTVLSRLPMAEPSPAAD